MAAELFDWQLPAKDKLVAGFRKGAGCLANTSETGTGKTLVALQTIKELGRPALIICPKAVRSTWLYWAKELGVSDLLIDVINPERISLGRSPHWDGDKWHISAGAIVVIDECHKGCSSPDSKLTRAVALLKAYRIPVLAMSATLASSPLNLRAIGYLLGLHTFGLSSFYDFCLRNGCTRGYMNHVEFKRGPRGEAAMQALHKQIEPYMVRIKVADVPGFPQGIVEAKLFDLEARATSEINLEFAEAAKKIQSHPHADPMVYLLRARQRAEMFKIPLLLDLIDEAVEEGHSVVVFLSFRASIEALNSALTHPRIVVWGRDDDPDGKKRDADVSKFQRDEAIVCVAQSGAGGVGISLHALNGARPRRSLINPSFSASEVKQCLGRIHRAGGSDVVQTFVLASGTIEERVYASLQNKLKCIETLQDGNLMEGILTP